MLFLSWILTSVRYKYSFWGDALKVNVNIMFYVKIKLLHNHWDTRILLKCTNVIRLLNIQIIQTQYHFNESYFSCYINKIIQNFIPFRYIPHIFIYTHYIRAIY